MRYLISIEDRMEQDDLDRDLRRDYAFSLLNFAAVIADVLAESSIFSMNIWSIAKKDVKNKYLELTKIKKKIIYLSKDPKLQSFSNTREDLSKLASSIDKTAKAFLKVNRAIDECMLTPRRQVKPRLIKKSNQVGLLCASAMRGKNNSIHWKNIQNLFNWFLEHLQGADYFAREELTDIAALKIQYYRAKKRYPPAVHALCSLNYFPFWNNKYHKPNFMISYISEG
jgi:hypothetical protein